MVVIRKPAGTPDLEEIEKISLVYVVHLQKVQRMFGLVYGPLINQFPRGHWRQS